jgi:hypothetical protein
MLHFQQKEPCPGWKIFTRKENRKRVIVLDSQLLLIHYYSEDDNGRKKPLVIRVHLTYFFSNASG